MATERQVTPILNEDQVDLEKAVRRPWRTPAVISIRVELTELVPVPTPDGPGAYHS